MLKRIGIILIFLGMGNQLIAQKSLEKLWLATDIDTVLIDSDALYKIKIRSEDSNEIRLETKVEGEYFEAVVVNSVIKGRTLNISAGFTPFFIRDNDKLAAHKVLAIESSLVVPEDLAMVVRSRLASLEATGRIAYLEAILSEGSIDLDDYYGDAKLYTDFGNISVKANPNVGARASTLNGKVNNELPLEGARFIEAKSMSGIISLTREGN